jgi:polysaccharide export outer membrane protein
MKFGSISAVATLLCFGAMALAQGVTPTPASEGPPPQTVSPDYVIGPGDSLNVFVWRNPELTVTVPVRPDGKISTPLVEDMVAVGKTPAQLARDIEQVLSEYVKQPQVNIIVTNPVSVFSQVTIVGQVAHPSAVAYREGMTVMDAILQVGGLSPYAAGNRAKIVRKQDGKQREIKVRLEDLVNKGDLKQNVALLPGDVVVVPESFF